jgi:hypothetical protein
MLNGMMLLQAAIAAVLGIGELRNSEAETEEENLFEVVIADHGDMFVF